MDFDYDVIIIGAGPVGGYTSRLLCNRGLTVLMVEEHNEVGRPFQCAGLVTPSAMATCIPENTNTKRSISTTAAISAENIFRTPRWLSQQYPVQPRQRKMAKFLLKLESYN